MNQLVIEGNGFQLSGNSADETNKRIYIKKKNFEQFIKFVPISFRA